jgi:hypothetical protein
VPSAATDALLPHRASAPKIAAVIPPDTRAEVLTVFMFVST